MASGRSGGPPPRLPRCILSHILLQATPHEDLLTHVATVASVCAEWRRAVMRSPAYGLNIKLSQLPAALAQRIDTVRRLHTNPFQNLRSSRETPRGRKVTDQDVSLVVRCTVLSTIRDQLKKAADGKLHLGAVYMGPDALRALTVAILARPSPLTVSELHINSGCLMPPATITPIVRLLKDGHFGTSLTELDVSSEHLGDVGVAALAAALPPTIQTLCFMSVECGDAGMIAVAEAIPRTKLQLLYCDTNPRVTAAGWAQLGAALPRTRANVLALCAELGVAGVTALAEGLAESSLIWLHLGHRMSTGMGVAGALALAAALPHSKLRGLKIEGVQGAQDEIGEEGRAALEDAAALVPGFNLVLAQPRSTA
eukprot:COSAG04_NODE_191_length_20909_cov_11.119077_16_plen_369_part_00